MVSKDAACIDTHFSMGLDANHSMMNKFFGPLDRNYGFVKQTICDLVADCERYITERSRLKGMFFMVFAFFSTKSAQVVRLRHLPFSSTAVPSSFPPKQVPGAKRSAF